MIDLTTIFKDFFDDRQHSDAELSRYASQHVALLIGNNPGNVLDARIAATQTVFSAFAACKGNKEFRAAARESANLAKRNYYNGLSGPIGRCAAAVEVAFGKGTPDYIACFPQGRTYITEANEDQVEPRLTGLLSALNARSATTGIPAQVTSITSVRTTWVALLAAADTADGTESGVDSDRVVCRKNLTRELSRNVTFLAFTYIEDFEKARLLLPQHLLRNAEPATVPPTPTLTMSLTENSSEVQADMTPTGEWTYDVERSGDGENWDWNVTNVQSGARFGDISGTFWYRARATNPAGQSAWSEPVQIVIP